jgi:hypothetical protein
MCSDTTRYNVPIEEVLKRYAVEPAVFCDQVGIGMHSYRHYRRGSRIPSIETVMAAEQKCGIPRHELRPDLWAPPVADDTKRKRKAA